MAVLLGAWGAAITNPGLATASNGVNNPGIPAVPTTAFEQPASIQSGLGVDSKAGAAGTLSTLSTTGIPAASLLAYRRAETLLAKADPSCHLPWTLIAAIGRVESNHGRSNGNAVNADGVSTPGIFGVSLTGTNGTSKVSDTDNGHIDNDAVYDRAVGPMQFLPATWKSVGVDADGDGKKNPQDIDDAAAAAGVYLCAGTGDLSTKSGASAAVLRYNHSSSYVDLVLKVADAYAQGDFTQSPNGYTASSVLTSQSYDQTLTPAQRSKAKKAEDNANKPKPDGSGSTPGSGGTGSTPGTGGGTGSTPPGNAGGGSSSNSGSISGLVNGVVGDLTGTTGGGTASTPSGGSATLTWAQAKFKCIADGIAALNVLALAKCITDLLK